MFIARLKRPTLLSRKEFDLLEETFKSQVLYAGPLRLDGDEKSGELRLYSRSTDGVAETEFILADVADDGSCRITLTFGMLDEVPLGAIFGWKIVERAA